MPSSCSRYAVRSTSAGVAGPGAVTAATRRLTRSSTVSGAASLHGGPVLGVGAEVVAEGGRAAEHGEDPLAGPTRRTERAVTGPRSCGFAGDRLHEPHQPEQGAVGVGHLGECGGQALALDVVARADQPGEGGVVEQRLRPGRVGEPEPGDGDRDRARAASTHHGHHRHRRGR